MKRTLRALFAAVLARQAPAAVMAPAIEALRRLGGAGGRFLVLAYGKAARGMAQAVVEGLGAANVRGLVVPIEPDAAPLEPFEVIPGGHPLPSAGSLRAGARALALARSVTRDEVVVFLASGGGSAAMELPAVDGVSLTEVQALHRALVGSGADIVAINTVRRQLSAVKGGRLAAAAAAAQHQVTVIIRDVPWREGALVASGPSEAVDVAPGAAAAVLDRFGLWPAVPAQLREAVHAGAAPGDAPQAARLVINVSCNEAALHDAARTLRNAGVHAIVDGTTDDWPCERAAAFLLRRLDRLHRRWPGRRVAVVAGGELSVPLPADPGTGGRNQQFVLACARLIRGRPITVLSCGTDGIDGNSPAAGAIADGTTMVRAKANGRHVHDALRRCDAFPLLQALGDTVVTGPSGTNVRDLRLLVHRG